MQVRNRPWEHPTRNLLLYFVGWKLLLLLIAASSPGPGYDTSTRLLRLSLSLSQGARKEELPAGLRYIIDKLTRWDAIYFVTTGARGYLFEQEWAFGWGFTQAISLIASGLDRAGLDRYAGLEALVAICIAHISHLLSVLALYHLTLAVFHGSPVVAFTTASLHIISPAGIFLSAPYAESSCAFLTFTGCLLFTKSLANNGQTTAKHDLLVISAGVLFGIATTFRSNGILNGLLLLEEAFRMLFRLKSGFRVAPVRRLLATGVGGLSVAVGFLLPQYIAYSEFCTGVTGPDIRPWCERSLPSIYTFVQDHYWNCGLFRYWTLSNVPLFLLSAPMFALLIVSGFWALDIQQAGNNKKFNELQSPNSKNTGEFNIVRNLAIAQFMLVSITLTTAHVQIITRISSAYPVWMWYASVSSRQGNAAGIGKLVRFMVMYGMIQAGLFATFLPPA